jgi:mannosyltransferase
MLHIDGIVFSIQRAGGISVYFKELIKYLDSCGIQYITSLEMPIRNGSPLAADQKSMHLRPSRPAERYRKCRKVKNCRLFHSSYYRIPDDTKSKSVVTVYDFIYERYLFGIRKWIHSLQKQRAIKAASAIICISNQTKSDLLRFVPGIDHIPIHVIPCGASIAFTRNTRSPKTTPYLLFVGGRNGYKNFVRIAPALSRLKEYQLVCVGGGNLSEFELQKFDQNARKRIRHVGYVTEDELNDLYNNAHCLLYISDFEGFGIPIVEAMRSGCPVITSQCPTMLEVGGDAIEIVNPLCIESLVGSVRMLENPTYREIKIDSGLRRSSEFTWENCHKKTAEVYLSLVQADG